jgi:hypothetical protein
MFAGHSTSCRTTQSLACIVFIFVVACCDAEFWCWCRLHKPLDDGAPKSLFAWEWHDASDLYLTYLLRGKPGALMLLALRVFMVVFFVFGLLFQEFAPRSVATGLSPREFIFFTNWTWYMFGLLSALGCVVSLRGLRKISFQLHATVGAADVESFDVLAKAYAALGAAVPTCAIFLTMFYWAVLYDGSKVRYVLMKQLTCLAQSQRSDKRPVCRDPRWTPMVALSPGLDKRHTWSLPTCVERCVPAESSHVNIWRCTSRTLAATAYGHVCYRYCLRML